MLVSVTRLHVRRWWFLPSFAIHTLRSARHAERSAGFLAGTLAVELALGFWTFTVWTDEQAMRGFRNTAAHLQAMPKLLDWCDEASYVHWQQEDASVPTTAVALKRLSENGKLSKVRQPSGAHAAGSLTAGIEPKAAGRPLRPRLS